MDIHDITRKPDSLRYDLKFFPKDYSIAVPVGRSKDKYYIAMPLIDGMLEIGENDSVRFLDPYNSFLGNVDQITNIVQVGDDTWLGGGEALYRCNDGDTVKYEIQAVYPHSDIFPGKNNIWLAYSDRLYLVRDEAVVLMKTPERVIKWISGAEGSMIGYTKAGRYIINEHGIRYKNKPVSKVFPAFGAGTRKRILG